MSKEQRVMRIGTRRSALALAQTRMVIEACRAADPEIRYEIVEMNTAGDAIADRPLYEFEGKGMFVSAFEEALEEGKIDAAVHSGKDMPVRSPGNLKTGAVLQRGSPGDMLVTVRERKLEKNSVIGTASLRRQQQVRSCLGYETRSIRGNVGTRLGKLLAGEVDGLILAAAGLERLSVFPGSVREMEAPQCIPCGGGEMSLRKIRETFAFTELSVKEFLPAAAQGIIALQCRKDTPFWPLFTQISDRDTMYCFRAEQAYLGAVDADCRQPVAAYSRCRNGILHMEAAFWKEDRYFCVSGAGPAADCERLGRELAEKILGLL